MHYEEFVNRVNERIQEKTPGEAEFAIQARLSTLGECVSGREAESLASELPVELAMQLESGNYAEEAKSFSLTEFYQRISGREGALYVEGSTVRARAVMTALLETVTGGGLTSMKLRLPEEFEPLSKEFEPPSNVSSPEAKLDR